LVEGFAALTSFACLSFDLPMALVESDTFALEQHSQTESFSGTTSRDLNLALSWVCQSGVLACHTALVS
jgi:hypothetical protein